MPRDVDPRYLEFWKYSFVSVQSMTKQVAAIMERESGMSMESYDLLVQLEYMPDGALRMSDLAERALLSPSGITRAIDRLTKLGYVVREADPSDRRATLARITPEGVAARETAWCTYRAAVLEILTANLSPSDAERGTKVMRKVAPKWLD